MNRVDTLNRAEVQQYVERSLRTDKRTIRALTGVMAVSAAVGFGASRPEMAVPIVAATAGMAVSARRTERHIDEILHAHQKAVLQAAGEPTEGLQVTYTGHPVSSRAAEASIAGVFTGFGMSTFVQHFPIHDRTVEAMTYGAGALCALMGAGVFAGLEVASSDRLRLPYYLNRLDNINA